jgi:hypothetical protein
VGAFEILTFVSWAQRRRSAGEGGTLGDSGSRAFGSGTGGRETACSRALETLALGPLARAREEERPRAQ